MSEQEKDLLIKDVIWINEGVRNHGDVYFRRGRIEALGNQIRPVSPCREISGEGRILLPGIIDDQVHFRDYDLSHKGTLRSESRAAAAGGVTSVMEMPNTRPPTTSWQAWREKNARGAEQCSINYAFYMGTTHENAEEVLSQYPQREICGLKIFMGSSTGNMLVDEPEILERFFSAWPGLIATHCEDEGIIEESLKKIRERYPEGIPPHAHPEVRPRECCIRSSTFARQLAETHGTRLHVLHLTTAEEAASFSPEPLSGKKITCEVCVHHLTFSDRDYENLGSEIKCNPAIKTEEDRDALWKALHEGRIDVIATDHAPHTHEEKVAADYSRVPAGLPLIQHSLGLMLSHVDAGRLTLEQMVDWMSHRVADCYRVEGRGYLREGYWADAVLVDCEQKPVVTREDLLYGCGWSPLEGRTMGGRVVATFVNGQVVYENGSVMDAVRGQALKFVPR